MNCPKCEEGTLMKIRFKDGGKEAFVCDSCDALWFGEESISEVSGHTLHSYLKDRDLQYSIEEVYDKDQDNKLVY